MNKVIFPSPKRFGLNVYNGWVFRESRSIKPNSSTTHDVPVPFDHLTTKEDFPVLELTTDCATTMSSPTRSRWVWPNSESATQTENVIMPFESSHFAIFRWDRLFLIYFTTVIVYWEVVLKKGGYYSDHPKPQALMNCTGGVSGCLSDERELH